MRKLLLFHIAFLFCWGNVLAQQVDSTRTDSSQTDLQSRVNQTTQDSLLSDEEEVEVVIPWQQSRPLAARQIANDSTLRWQIWPNWGDFYAYRNDVISYRQGTIGQTDAFHINGYLPSEQTVTMEGIKLNDPVTGLVNYSLVPHHKILEVSEQQFGGYYSDIKLKDYYLTSPISYLNYDESKYNYRNLEFMVTQNFTARTNLELSFWDRRDGDYYPRDDVQGSQVYGRVYHHLNPNYQIRAMYLRNQFNNQESFGYVVGNPQAFAFDQYASSPNQSSSSSDFTRWDLVAGIYHRADTTSKEDSGLELFISKNKNNLTYSSDTLDINLTSFGTRLYRHQRFGRAEVYGEVEGIIHNPEDEFPVNKSSWTEVNASADVQYQLTKNHFLYGSAKFHRKAEAYGGETGGGVYGELGGFLKYRFGAFKFHKIPTIQAGYWSSDQYYGSVYREGNEDGESLSGMLEAALGSYFKVGLRGRYKSVESSTILNHNSNSIEEGDGYRSLNGTLYGSFENHRFEIKSSGTYQKYDYSTPSLSDPVYNYLDDALWIRNSVHIKGYAFQRATYLKMGLRSLLSPLSYSSRTYNTALGFWQANSEYIQIPAFFRLDAELSARIRRIMVVMRWENVLDGFGQAGYFEAAGYPMPPRRLVVGIRARFIN